MIRATWWRKGAAHREALQLPYPLRPELAEPLPVLLRPCKHFRVPRNPSLELNLQATAAKMPDQHEAAAHTQVEEIILGGLDRVANLDDVVRRQSVAGCAADCLCKCRADLMLLDAVMVH